MFYYVGCKFCMDLHRNRCANWAKHEHETSIWFNFAFCKLQHSLKLEQNATRQNHNRMWLIRKVVSISLTSCVPDIRRHNTPYLHKTAANNIYQYPYMHRYISRHSVVLRIQSRWMWTSLCHAQALHGEQENGKRNIRNLKYFINKPAATSWLSEGN